MKKIPGKRQKTLTARSFNMERLKVVDMFNRPPASRLVMPISLVHFGRTILDAKVAEYLRLRQIIEAGFNSGLLDPSPFGITASIEPLVALDVNSTHMLDYLHRRNWEHNGFYIQASFVNARAVNSSVPFQATGSAQTYFDVLCDRTRSLDPIQHQPIQNSYRQVRELVLMIGDYYKEGIGVWCKELQEYRTAVLVMLRAACMGRGALQEYQRFTAAGGKYFLEYPVLCP